MWVEGDHQYLRQNRNEQALRLIEQVQNECESLMAPEELYQIFLAVLQTAKIPGEIAEMGVYQGASAKIICEAKGEKTLHLFDTFEGLPLAGENDSLQGFEPFHTGQFKAGIDMVKSYLSGYAGIVFHQGFFPETAAPVRDVPFSFVHLDADLYESTKNCLEFFYPRMSPGGIIISHDYVHSGGVRKAFDEYFAEKRTPIVMLPTSQCLIVKLPE